MITALQPSIFILPNFGALGAAARLAKDTGRDDMATVDVGYPVQRGFEQAEPWRSAGMA